MKKSVVILILIIYIASVALVSFFGLQYKETDPTIYVTGIEFLNKDIKIRPDGTRIATAQKDETGVWRYQIQYRVYPDNASNNGVDFVYDTQASNVSVDETTGVVTFTGKGALTVTLMPADGSKCSATLQIWAI